MRIYSGFFEFGGRGHVTWEFKPKHCSLPVAKGTQVSIMVVAKYSDKDIDADIVQVVLPGGEVLTTQKSSDRLLHITRATRNGVSPVQSGIRATAASKTADKKGLTDVQPYKIRAKASYFEKKGK